MAVLVLVATPVEIDGERVDLAAGTVYDLDPKLGKSLVKQGIADDTPANIAFHRGDLDLYRKLLQDAEDAKAGKRAGPTGGGATQPTAAQQAAQETDAEKATALRAEAAQVLQDAGLVSE
jgi:hypothetical protein